jgi:hypothetical protein
MPLAPVEEDMAQQAYPAPTAAPQGLFAHDSPYQPPVQSSFDQSFDNDTTPGPQIDEGGRYMPPGGTTGYEPPSFSNGPELEVTEDSEDEKPRKKSFMDEDEDEIAREKAERARRDQEADAAFRAAAEADGTFLP